MTGADSDRGSMLVEVVFLMVLLMVPLLYLVGTLGRLQAGAYAASAAAREAGRAYVTTPDDRWAPGRADSAAALVFDSFGFDQSEGAIVVGCSADPCLAPGDGVQVQSTVVVPVPLIPDFMSGAIPTSVTMTSTHSEPVDEFREG
jgi:hypothetical protein